MLRIHIPMPTSLELMCSWFSCYSKAMEKIHIFELSFYQFVSVKCNAFSRSQRLKVGSL